MKSDFGKIRKSSKRAVFDIIPYRPRGEEPRSFDSTRRFFKPNDSRRTIKLTSHLKVKNLIRKILRKYVLVEKIRSNRRARFVRDLEKSQRRHDALEPRQQKIPKTISPNACRIVCSRLEFKLNIVMSAMLANLEHCNIYFETKSIISKCPALNPKKRS